MTYGECRDLALNLIHQESIAGVTIPGSYNNQQDYLNKIPGLINAAQVDIATTTKPIPAWVELGDLMCIEKHGNYVYTLPEDLWQRRGSGLIFPSQEKRSDYELHYDRYNHVRMIGNNQIILSEKLPPDTILEYYRYPVRMQNDPEDDDLLDNVPEAQEAVPYYVAAHIVMYDDAFLYATLQNEYSARKDAMRDQPRTEVDQVRDVYSSHAADYYFWG